MKTSAVGQHERRSLLECVRRFPKYRPLLACDPEHLSVAAGFGITGLAWSQFIFAGPPREQTR